MRAAAPGIAPRARAARAAAVVLWLIEEDEALPWEIARQMRSLEAARIPCLRLARQTWPPDAAACAQVRRFVAGPEVAS
jgi:hypothetical protein